ncbi:hypothetical protein Bbelb_387700 [Branchiostoma belcheri]|nr:hypothetical protein Bbelb_387700 [Branchiostoma belcheri]
MSMRLPLLNKHHATLFSVYAPTLLADPSEKDTFYTDLRHLIQSTPENDKVFVLGDFNARVGRDFEVWKGVIGKHGIGNCNDNGRLLLELCSEQKIVITNTIFQQKDRHRTIWMHPRSRHWHLIDYILVRQRDLQDVLHTRTWGDYRGFYEALKAVYGPSRHVQNPLRSADGQTLLTDKSPILTRWAQYYQALFSSSRDDF